MMMQDSFLSSSSSTSTDSESKCLEPICSPKEIDSMSPKEKDLRFVLKHPSWIIPSIPLPLLCCIWASLCTFLVLKYPRLISVFLAFIACLAVHFILSTPPHHIACWMAGFALWYGNWIHLSLSIVSGYLAFCHWSYESSRIQEDAMTLTVALILLVLYDDHDDAEWPNLIRSGTSLWLVTHWLRLVLSSNDGKTQKGKPACSGSLGVWRIHGKEYDLSEYVNQHPGGREAIMLGMNREDCTALFESYHPFTKENAQSVLRKYVRSNQKLAYSADPFYQELCDKVAVALRSNGIDPIRDRTASRQRQFHYVVVVFGVICSGFYHFKGSILGSFTFAVFGWLLGSLGHDAGHFCASRNPLVNDIGVWAMSLLCNPILWQHQHTYAHHSHTNDIDHDPDLHHFTTLLRVHQHFRYQNIYKNQSSRIYVFFAYMFVVFGTCIWIPWGMVQDGALYNIVDWTDRHRNRGYGMYFHWILYAGGILLWPFWVHDHWWQAAFAVLAHVSTSGWIFAIFSQINHLNEDSFLLINADNSLLRTSWAAQQVATSNNFCPQSRLWHVLSNGLNLQIEHHLFPGLNHCHLSLIQPTVQEICHRHNVPYKSYDGWTDIMSATLQWLDRLSLPPKVS